MKINLTILLFFLLSVFTANSQTFKASYVYDNNGNRVSASIIYLSIKSAVVDTTKENFNEKDSTLIDFDPEKISQKQLDSLGNYTVRIFPNPTQGDLLIEINGIAPIEFNKNNNSIKILNLSGQLVLNINDLSAYNTTDLSQISSGTYIVVLNINNRLKTFKIIKK